MMRKELGLLANVMAFLMAFSSISWSQATLESYKIRVGTLEIIDSKLVFTSEEKAEVLSPSPLDLLSASGLEFPRIPGLREIGFKATSGEIFMYPERNRESFLSELFREKPDTKPIELIYRNDSGDHLTVRTDRKAQVIRVDLNMVPGGVVTLWKKLEPKTEESALLPGDLK